MFDLGTAVGYLELDTSGIQSGVKKTISEFKKLGDSSYTLQMKTKSLGQGFQSAGSLMTKYFTLPLAGIGTASVAAAGSFESAMSKISAATGGTEKDMQKFEETLKNVYKGGYGEGFEDIADAIAEVNKQIYDLPQEELESVVKSAIALRDTFGYDIQESIRAVSTLMENFGLESEQAFDLIVEGAQNGLDFSNELIDSINEYSVQFQKLGLDAEDMFRIFQNGADSGAFNLDKIGDAVKEFSIRVVDGSDTTIAAFDSIGMNYTEMANKFSQGGEEARQAFQDVIDGLMAIEDPLERNTAGVNLFGTMWEDLGENVIASLGDIENASYNASGAMDELLEKRYDNIQGDLNMLMKEFTLLGVEIGEILLPYIRQFVQWLTQLAQWFSNLDDGVKNAVVVIGTIVAAIGSVLTIIGNLITLFSTIGPIIMALINPFTLIVGAIGGLAIAYKTNLFGIKDKVQEFVNGVSQYFNGLVESAKQWFADLLDSITEAFNNVIKWFGEIPKKISEVFTSIIENAKSFINEFYNKLVNSIKSAIDNIVQWWNDLPYKIGYALGYAIGTIINWADEIYNFVTVRIPEIIDEIANWFATLPTRIQEWLQNTLTSIQEWANETYNYVLQYLENLRQTLSNWINNVYERAKQLFNQAKQAIIDWGTSVYNNVVQTLTNFINAVITWLSKLPGIFRQWLNDVVEYLSGLPSKFLQLGEDIMNGFFDGIKNIGDQILDWFDGIVNSIQDFLQGIWDGISDAKDAMDEAESMERGSSHAAGLDYVPHDGYRAILHEGEAVLTKEENKNRKQTSGNVFVFNSPDPIDEVKAAQQFKKVQKELAKGL